VTPPNPGTGGVSRANVCLGGLVTLVLSIWAGIGGPPSEFRADPPWLATVLGAWLLEIYMAGACLALAGVLMCPFIPRMARVVATGAASLTLAGNVVSGLIGAGGEWRAAGLVLLLQAPFVLVMWQPPASSPGVDSGKSPVV
jgi:hypothetical protein